MKIAKPVERQIVRKRVILNVPEWIVDEYDKMADEVGATRNVVMQMVLKTHLDQLNAMKTMEGMKDIINSKIDETFKLALDDKNGKE